MLKPSPQASKQATLGLALLEQQIGESFVSTPPAVLGRKIQNGEPLNDLEVGKIKDFNSRAHEATPAWVAAFNLYGGQPMVDQVKALPVKPVTPKAVVAVGLREDTQQILQLDKDHTCDSFVLFELGDLPALDESDRMQAELVCETVAKAFGPVDCQAKWRTEAITAAGYQTDIVFGGSGLHGLHGFVSEILNRYGVPYDDSEPWLPRVVQSVTAQAEQSLHAPFGSVVDRIVLDWGGDKTVYRLAGVEAVTAAVTAPDPIVELGDRLFKRLQVLDERWLTALEAIFDMAVNQALEKIGRTLKKKAPEVYMTVTAAPMAPHAVAMVANADVLAAVNVAQLISAPVDDAVKQAEDLTRRHIEAVGLAVGSGLGLSIDLSARYGSDVKRAVRLLKNRLKDWIVWRLNTSDGKAKLDDFTRVVDAPADLVRDFASVAGGDSVVKDDKGLVRPSGEVNLLPALAVGAVGLGVVDKAFDVLRGSSVKGYGVEAGGLSGLERAALDGLGPDSVLRVGGSYRWTANYYGKIKTVHHPRHKPNFGLVVSDVSEVSGDRPGDHPFCKCGWRPEFGIILE